jgi:CheY-like chemotaxis protein
MTLNILLVEDEPADAHLVRLAFEEGHVLVNLNHVCDGVEALDYLERKPPFGDAPAPDIILLDLNMPRMDGRQFLRTIKDRPQYCGIPVIVLTTSDAETDLISSYGLGAASYVVKPIDVDDFLARVRAIGDYWISIVRLPAH